MSSSDNLMVAKKILAAIEDKRYKSRTILGIAKSVETSEDVVRKMLKSDPTLRSNVMAVPGIKKNNRVLYTTVDRYKSGTPLAIRVFNLMNKRSTQDE